MHSITTLEYKITNFNLRRFRAKRLTVIEASNYIISNREISENQKYSTLLGLF